MRGFSFFGRRAKRDADRPRRPADAALPIATATTLLRPARLHGYVDIATVGMIAGWVQDQDDVDERLTVILLDHGVELGRAEASTYRGDLEFNGVGDGRYGFVLEFASGFWTFGDHELRLISLRDRARLPDPLGKLARLQAQLA